IKSGITPVKSRDSATLFLFNCRRWDYNTKKQKIKGLFWKSKKCLSGNANELQGCEDEENS
ncbi:hypothetical protein, partial [Blautia wexlerae]|uniref:hypothetical protein n=1 Tax=Blautia wexlerae TaxID=418240 RepID=UPI0034A1A606